MPEDPRPTRSLRDLLVNIRRRLPWPGQPAIVRPDPRDLAAEKARAQLDVIRRAFREVGEIAFASADGTGRTEDGANAQFLYRPGVALVRENTDERAWYDEFSSFFTDADRRDLFEGREPRRRDEETLPAGLVLVDLPARSDSADDVLATLEELDRDRRARRLEGVVAQPDHVLHVTYRGSYCPHTEPERPSGSAPVPGMTTDSNAGSDVRVSVVDTGLWPGSTTHKSTTSWMSTVTADKEDEEVLAGTTIHEYAGHGTFVSGVIKCLAPQARVEVEGALTHGGAVSESEICKQLHQALDETDLPQLISISAGTYTRKNLGLLGFEILMATKGADDGVKTIVVAAAGNDTTCDPFYPAAYPWVIAVGSVDPDGKRSDFSNYGPWVDVYARGRDLVNAFPVGTYTCHYPQNIDPVTGPEVRQFDGMAQWSGTSFATPIVTGAIAAHMSATGTQLDPWQAYQDLLQAAKANPPGPDGKPIIGPVT